MLILRGQIFENKNKKKHKKSKSYEKIAAFLTNQRRFYFYQSEKVLFLPIRTKDLSFRFFDLISNAIFKNISIFWRNFY